MATRQVHDQGQAKRVGRARETTKPAVSGKDLAAPTRVLQQTVADPAAAAPSDILALQQAYGNQAVVGLLAPQVAEHAGSPLPIQAKLIVGPVDDPYEREADRVAERVTKISPTTDSPPVQRYAEDEEELQMKPLVAHQGPSGVGPVQGKGLVQRYAEEEEELQTKPLAVRHKMAFEADDGLVQRLCSLKGGGAPLPDHVRADMEARFGANFSNVRVHADAEAGQLNQAIRARAFTHGTDVYFTYGQYNPESINGKRLLAHELTHVIQQTGQGPRELAAGATGKSKRVSSRVESAQAANPSRVPGSLHTVQRDGDQPSLEDEEEKRRQQGTSLVPPKPTKPLPPLPVQGRPPVPTKPLPPLPVQGRPPVPTKPLPPVPGRPPRPTKPLPPLPSQTSPTQENKPGLFGKVKGFFSNLLGKKEPTIPEAPPLPDQKPKSQEPLSFLEQIQAGRMKVLKTKSKMEAPSAEGVGQAPTRWEKFKGAVGSGVSKVWSMAKNKIGGMFSGNSAPGGQQKSFANYVRGGVFYPTARTPRPGGTTGTTGTTGAPGPANPLPGRPPGFVSPNQQPQGPAPAQTTGSNSGSDGGSNGGGDKASETRLLTLERDLAQLKSQLLEFMLKQQKPA